MAEPQAVHHVHHLQVTDVADLELKLQDQLHIPHAVFVSTEKAEEVEEAVARPVTALTPSALAVAVAVRSASSQLPATCSRGALEARRSFALAMRADCFADWHGLF